MDDDNPLRYYLQSAPGFILTLYLGCINLPLPQALKSPFRQFLTIEEAEALISEEKSAEDTRNNESRTSVERAPLWLTFSFPILASLETMAWFTLATYRLSSSDEIPRDQIIAPFLNAIAWLLPTVLPILRPKATAPLDLFAFYVVQLGEGIFRLVAFWYDNNAHGATVTSEDVAVSILNVLNILVLAALVLSMPMNPPKALQDKSATLAGPEDYIPLWQWVTFEWISPLLRRGNNHTLTESDVYDLSPTMSTKAVYLKFASLTRKTLLRRIIAANAFDIATDFTLNLLSIVFSYGGPFFLNRILEALQTSAIDPEARSRAYLYAFMIFFCGIGNALSVTHQLWHGRRAATRIKSELMAAIYAKALLRKDYSGVSEHGGDGKGGKQPEGASAADVGKIVNLMSGDANRVSMSAAAMYFLYGAPFEIIIASVFLYKLLGLSAFVGFVCLLAASPVTKLLAEIGVREQKGLYTARDTRTTLLNELLNGIKLVKFYGWEDRWTDRILDARAVELKWLWKFRVNNIYFAILWASVPILISVISLTTFVMTGHELTVPTAFTALSLFGMLRKPLNGLPEWIVQVIQTGVAIKRIDGFLSEEEVPEEVSNLKPVGTFRRRVDNRLGIEHASFKWNEASTAAIQSRDVPINANSDRRFELKDINIVLPEEELTMVTGPTASGKTALLMALLGEMTMLPGSGHILLPKHVHPDANGLSGISYAAQSPFLQHQSIRDNILFGSPYDEERYQAVLEACALNPDLEIFEEKDLTEIGSRGISLSGGQKARVALARAVYAKSKCVLLDDPLSAVDSHTALHLYEQLIKGPLLAGRTIVLVTHNVELVLPSAHYLVKMHDGRIEVQGTVESLRFKGILDTIIEEETAEYSPPSPPAALKDAQNGTNTSEKNATDAKRPRQLVQDEARQVGNVQWRVYKTYMKAASYITWIVLLVAITLSQFLGVGEKLWVKQWGEAYKNPLVSLTVGLNLTTLQNTTTIPLPSARQHPLFYVGIYTGISFGAALLGVMVVVVEYLGSLRASRVLFKRLLVSIMRGTMRWHDSTPIGRTLNRFTKDMDAIDTSLGTSIQEVLTSMATFVAAVITVIVFTPAFIFPAIVIGFIYYKLAISYLRTGRDLRRMEANARSPIFANFSELLAGIVTIRAFSAERRLMDNVYNKIDLTTKMGYAYWMITRWLFLHSEFLGSLAVLFTSLFAVSGTIGAGLAGVTITSAMGFKTALYWACRFWIGLELDLNSVERIVEYLDLPKEPPAIIESRPPPAYWPSSSDNSPLVNVNKLVIRYAPNLPPVLHEISFQLKAGERIGLLGRTGSGKSTLAMSLLRFTDPSSGTISIDGIDITTIGTQDLRSRITFVAQDAMLFSGTIRENVDPFGDYTDSECWNALSRVHLTHSSQTTPEALASARPEPHNPESVQGTITLDTKVSAGGANFSQGQRQLLTMARALLRQSKIIILDEATSSIDYEMDVMVQRTIREEFGNSLLLTIAHRLRTVIDYDRLIVLDEGKIVEHDTPYNLIRKEGGLFRNMCIHSGNFNDLELAAKDAVPPV